MCPHDGTLLSDTVSFEEQAVGKTLDGKYRIDGFLKRGGMGAVYRGTHLMLNKPVAIKLIKPELVSSTDVVQRFLREARAAAHLSHGAAAQRDRERARARAPQKYSPSRFEAAEHHGVAR